MTRDVVTNWDDILLKECERIMTTPTMVPNETLRVLKLANDMEMADGESTSSISEESPEDKPTPARLPRRLARPRQRAPSLRQSSCKIEHGRREASQTHSSQLPTSSNQPQPPEMRQSRSLRNIGANMTKLQQTTRSRSSNPLLASFFGSEPLDITNGASNPNAAPETEDTVFPDRSALSNFFGKAVDGRPSFIRKFSGKKPRPATPQAKEIETKVSQDPRRAKQLNDPDLPNKSLEELMMERFEMKLEDAICLVADARTNMGINKWQPWGLELYEECERMYAESYNHVPSTPSSKTSSRSKDVEISSNVADIPSLEIPKVHGLPKIPSRQTIVSATEDVSSVEDASGWESTSGWSSLWEDSNALQGGFSRKTYDKNDEYTIDVIKDIERKYTELEAKEKGLECQIQPASTKENCVKGQNRSKSENKKSVTVSKFAVPKVETAKVASDAVSNNKPTQRRKWFGTCFLRNK